MNDLREQKALLLESLEVFPDGLDWCDRWAEVLDEAVRRVYRETTDKFKDLPPISIAAVGGYGRREMAPCSDADLAVIPLEEGPQTDQAIRFLFRRLHEVMHDVLGVGVDYSYRLIADTPGLDAKSLTGLLDARLAAGSYRPLEEFLDELWAGFPVGDFILDKIEERQRLLARSNDTPLAAFPDLKEGAGGIRCVHAANWIAAALGERPARPNDDFEIIVQARNVLHQIAGKRSEVLTATMQEKLAARLGLDPLYSMGRISQALSANHDRYLEAKDKIHDRRFQLRPGVHAIRGEVRVEADAHTSDAAFGISLAVRLGLTAAKLQVPTSGKVNGDQAIRALACGEPTIRALDRCGILDQLLPELTACRTLLPDDLSHAYTVFEHSLRSIRKLDEARVGGGFFEDLTKNFRQLPSVYMALLLHDVGKQDKSGPHSETGAVIAKHVLSRWNAEPHRQQLIEWLVLHHLEMARFIRLRDIHHPETAAEFAELAADEERLTALTLLTYADISAVSPDSWTPVQEAFIKELYQRTLAILTQGEMQRSDPASLRRRAAAQIKEDDIPAQELNDFIESLPAHYMVSTPVPMMRAQFRLAQQAMKGQAALAFEPVREIDATEFMVCCPDEKGLLSRILGVLYACDIGLVRIRVCTTAGESPIAVDSFTVQFNEKPLPQATCLLIEEQLRRVIHSDEAVEALLMEKGKDIQIREQNPRFTFHEGHPAILEVRTARSRGLAYRLSRLIGQSSMNISAARIGQWAGQAAVSFYLTNPDGSLVERSQIEPLISPRV